MLRLVRNTKSGLSAFTRHNSSTAAPKAYTSDMTIIGGGPAGLSLATAITASKSLQLNFKLLEAFPLARLDNWATNEPVELENRVSSLTPRSVRFLKHIGAWEHILQHRVMPYDEMMVWDGVSGSKIEFDIFGSEEEGIAYMVENSNLQQALLQRLTELGVRENVIEARVGSVDAGAWPVVNATATSGESLAINSRLLVGADGQQSPVRKFAGIETRGWDYDRFGVVASLELEYDNYRAVAYQRFLPSGPIAMLPMPEGKATLVWSTTPERAQFLKQLEPHVFCLMVDAGLRLDVVDLDYIHTINPANSEEIIEEIEWRMSKISIEDEANSLPVSVTRVVDKSVAAFPLRMRHADTYVGERVALVGDAAHATHPLAGQGLNMGQRDVELLVDALEDGALRGLDIGSSLCLEPYWKNAYLPNHIKLGVVDKLHKLYSWDCYPVVKARSMGLDLVNSSTFIKDFLMKQASN